MLGWILGGLRGTEMRVWFNSDDVNEDVEDWKEVDFHHAACMDAPTSILTGATIQLDLTMIEARPEFGAWQETVRRD